MLNGDKNFSNRYSENNAVGAQFANENSHGHAKIIGMGTVRGNLTTPAVALNVVAVFSARIATAG